MELSIKNSPQLGLGNNPIHNDDGKNFSRLSTILVATIQEVKERISQIEYIFCNQLYPDFQSKSKCLQTIYSEVRKASEDAWKEKENDLLVQIKKLQHEKQLILEENDALQLEKAKLSKEQEETRNSHVVKITSLETQIDVLERELLKKSKEVDDGMNLHQELIKLVQVKTSETVEQQMQLKEHKDKINLLVIKVKCLGNKVDEVQKELMDEKSEVLKGKELQKDSLRRIELLNTTVKQTKIQLVDCEEEKRSLIAKVEELQQELGKKIEEVEKVKNMNKKLLQDTDLDTLKVLEEDQQLEKQNQRKNLLLTKQNGSEDKVGELQVEDLRKRSSNVAEENEVYKNLLKMVKVKDSELLSEKKMVKHLIVAYKSLKSQYNFLCKKMGLSAESMQSPAKLDGESDSLRQHQNPTTLPGMEIKITDTSAVASGANKVKIEMNFDEKLEEGQVNRPVQTSTFHPSSNPVSSVAPECSTSKTNNPRAGTKRMASYWRDTRSRQCEGGPDPHDNFLNTPLENIQENLNKATKEEVHGLPEPIAKDISIESSDDETQDMNVGKQQKPEMVAASRPSMKGFKYIEPVRKKAERDNLKGVECKQCRKFYDAVLPDGGKDADGNKHKVRCEHHDGVSRHRYRYIPPMTPEGFWNIGFDSEM